MRKTLTALCAAAVLFTACQKEPSFDDPSGNPGGGTGGPVTGLLVRSVEVSGTDSNVVAYTYNGAGKLTQIDASGTSASPLTYKLLRNAAGIITRSVAISPDLAAVGIDSLVVNAFYNAATSRYTHTRYDIDLGGVLYSDSTVYAYNSSGEITSATSYGKVLTTPYLASSRMDYTYSNGNVATQKGYTYDMAASTWTLAESVTYTYDTRVNPLKLGVEAILIGMVNYAGNNNPTLLDFTDPADASNNFSQASTYTYNSANKPSGGTMVENPGATNYTLRFYYN